MEDIYIHTHPTYMVCVYIYTHHKNGIYGISSTTIMASECTSLETAMTLLMDFMQSVSFLPFQDQKFAC